MKTSIRSSWSSNMLQFHGKIPILYCFSHVLGVNFEAWKIIFFMKLLFGNYPNRTLTLPAGILYVICPWSMSSIICPSRYHQDWLQVQKGGIDLIIMQAWNGGLYVEVNVPGTTLAYVVLDENRREKKRYEIHDWILLFIWKEIEKRKEFNSIHILYFFCPNWVEINGNQFTHLISTKKGKCEHLSFQVRLNKQDKCNSLNKIPQFISFLFIQLNYFIFLLFPLQVNTSLMQSKDIWPWQFGRGQQKKQLLFLQADQICHECNCSNITW